MGGKKRLFIGIACGVVAAAIVLLYAASVRAEEQEARADALSRYGGEQVEVCVAARDIAAGEELDSSSIEMQSWLADLLPDGCTSNPDDLIGKTASSSILANEPISDHRIGSVHSALDVPAGLCAVSVPAQDVRAVGGAIQRGSLVSIYATTDTGVVLLGERLLVLDTSSSTEDGASQEGVLSWVTLAVTPDSVQELLSASRSQTLYITLPSTGQSSGEAASELGGSDAGQAGAGLGSTYGSGTAGGVADAS